ncbi:Smad nuclear-interacting protein 1 [Terramyces sp. JEL0728]|nr:Smad nuclear-interacting protein 1 [Terramyces sp. JEL0728]
MNEDNGGKNDRHSARRTDQVSPRDIPDKYHDRERNGRQKYSYRERNEDQHKREESDQNSKRERKSDKRKGDFTDEYSKKPKEEEKEKPNFNQSGALAKDLNTVNGILLKYSEPPEARLPESKYRLYAFKNDKADIITIHKQSAYLVGRERKVCDIPLDHPSISSQHAVLQYRQVTVKDEYGVVGKKTKLYIIDLESSNGTLVNKKAIPPREDLGVLTRMAPAAVAASITTILTNPIWVVNTRLLVKRDGKVGMKKAVMDIYAEEGLSGFWKGILPAMVLVVNPVIQFAVFERLKKRLLKSTRYLTSSHYFLLGAFSKLCATLATYPYILLRSRLHIKREKASMIDEFQKIINEEGFVGLYKGIEANLTQSDKIETEIQLGKWDDSVLIDTWNLALAEYNKHYSIDPEIRPQKKNKRKKQEFKEMQPVTSKKPDHWIPIVEDEPMETDPTDEQPQDLEDGEFQETTNQTQPNRLLNNLFPSIELQCDSCNESDPTTSKLIARIMPVYYKGYQDGSEGKESSAIDDKLEQAWYTAGYETGQHVSTNL